MSNLRVLVIGASVAGPTVAYWLARAGAKVTVFERFSELRKGGQNVDIRMAGVTIMRRMPGMEAAVRAKRVEMDGIRIVKPNGKRTAVMTSSGDGDQQSLVSEFEIFRGDLSQILYDMTRHDENITYKFGTKIDSIRQPADGSGPVTVTGSEGSEEYDLVVACDGATSRTRAEVFGCDVRTHMHAVNSWAAYFTIAEDLLEGEKVGDMQCSVGGRALALGPDAPGVNRVTAMTVYPADRPDAMLPFRRALKEGDAAVKALVADTYKGCGWKTPQILAAMEGNCRDFYASEFAVVKPPSLHRGRVVFVGDAGYGSAYTGAGTTSAMAGAYVLAGEVARHPGDVAAALAAYEHRMRPLVEKWQKIPAIMPAAMAPQTAWGIWIRNILFSFFATASGLLSRVGGLFAASFGKDDSGIPEYKFQR